VEAKVGRSSAKVLMEYAVLMVSCFHLAPRPGIFAVLDLHKMDVSLIGWELTGVPGLWTKAGILMPLLRAPYPLCTLLYYSMRT